MTDNEIIKALECCCSPKVNACDDCPFHKRCYENNEWLEKESIDLINRQKSEIERLETNCLSMAQTMPNMAKAERAEAIKEFAEELIYKIVNTPTKFESTYYMYREGIAFRQNEIIDIIKEMAGEIDV